MSVQKVLKILYENKLEAVEKIAREIRLRDIGGIVIIDFIDMENISHRNLILKELTEAVKRDRTKTNVIEMTGLGLVEITRKRISQDLDNVLKEPCPYCKGEGKMLSPKSISIKVEREIRRQNLENRGDAIKVVVNPEVGMLLLGWEGERMEQLQKELEKQIYLYINENQHIKKYHIQFGTVEKIEEECSIPEEGEEIEVEIEDAHLLNFQNGMTCVKGHIIQVTGGGNLKGKKAKIKITRALPYFSKAVLS